MNQLTDLREILRYVPRFRDANFVIALDGAVVADDNFANILTDIHLLRSLNIGVLLVHGASQQIQELANQTGRTPSNTDGTGITDAVTLDLAVTASNRITHEILEGLAEHDLRGAYSNAVTAHPAGIIRGVNQQWTGKIEKIDVEMLDAFLKGNIIPVIPPLGLDGEGCTYRLNSDTVAVEVAMAVRAKKLIFLGMAPGIRLNGELLRQLSLNEATTILKSQLDQVQSDDLSKLEHATRAARLGVERVHVIDGGETEGVLAEVFSNEGIGTLIHANEYQSIRKAMKKDVRALHALIQGGMETDELMRRSRADIERQIDEFFIFEVDRTPAGCAALHRYPDQKKAEVACVYVDPRYTGHGIGLKMVRYAEEQARQAGTEALFALTTQAVNYFTQKCGFQLASPDDLPPARREQYDRGGRKSQVMMKRL